MELTTMELRELLDHFDQRLDERERHDDIRHRDLVRRFENLDHSVAKAHGRISTHDGIISRIERRVEQISSRVHDMSSKLTRTVQDQLSVFAGKSQATVSGDNQLLSRLDAKWIITLILGSMGATLAFLKFIGKLG